MLEAEQRRVLLEVKNLKKYFPLRHGFLGRGGGTVKAVDGVSLYIHQGETLGLVGESGSGKTTAGRTILRAFNPTEGEIIFHLQDGPAKDIAKMDAAELRRFRRHAQMIFQDPYSSLNPRMTVRDIIAEPLVAGGVAEGDEVDERVRETARLRPELGVSDPAIAGHNGGVGRSLGRMASQDVREQRVHRRRDQASLRCRKATILSTESRFAGSISVSSTLIPKVSSRK